MTGILGRLALKYQSDKNGQHFYTDHYERHFALLRDRALKVLEIGVGGEDDPLAGGASLRMWRDYFPEADVVGLDAYDKVAQQGDRIVTVQGNQADLEFLGQVNAAHGPFDIIIDDGGHENDKVIASFQTLFPLLKDGGIYVVEDVQTSYWKSKGGEPVERNALHTSVGFFKSLVDGLNHAEFDHPGYQPSYLDLNIVSLHFYHNLIFIYKGANNEGSNILTDNVLPPHYATVQP